MFRAAFPRISPSCPFPAVGGYVSVFSRNSPAQDPRPGNLGEACGFLPVTVDPIGRLAREGRKMRSLIRSSWTVRLHQATAQAAP